jgi:hypothetical protein
MRDLATAVGILIDKRRLEDGEASSVHEGRFHSTRETLNLQVEFAKLDAELTQEYAAKQRHQEFGE